MKALQIAILALMPVLAGCALSTGRQDHETTACTDLNNAIGDKAKEISGTAISRGNISSLSVPFWVPGGARAVSIIKNRQTARIEKLQAEQSVMGADRERRCRRPR